MLSFLLENLLLFTRSLNFVIYNTNRGKGGFMEQEKEQKAAWVSVHCGYRTAVSISV